MKDSGTLSASFDGSPVVRRVSKKQNDAIVAPNAQLCSPDGEGRKTQQQAVQVSSSLG